MGLRMFAAVRPTAEASRAIASLIERGSREAPGARWERPEQAHLTLAFWGSVPPESVAALVEALGSAASGTPAFSLTIDGAGAFPDRDRAKVVWLGATRGTGELKLLADAVRTAAVAAGVDGPHARFAPHLSLARPRDAASARSALDVADSFAATTWDVERFSLFESVTGDRGAEHRPVATFELAGR